MSVDVIARVEVQPVGCVSIRPDAGVQVDLATAEAAPCRVRS